MPEPIKATSQLLDAQLTIYIKALGVLVFNHDHEGNGRVEIGFLKVQGDEHAVLAGFYNRNGPPPDTECPTKIEGSKNFLGSGGRIEIYDNGCSAENFDRVVDLAEVYGDQIRFKNDPSLYVAKMFIENAVVSVDGPSFVRAKGIPVKGSGPAIPAFEMARAVKIQIKGETQKITINGKDIQLLRDGLYDIVIDSDCRDTEGDFKHFYDVLDGAGDTQYNLKFENAARLFAAGQDKELGELLDDVEGFLNKDEIRSGSEIADKDEHSEKVEKLRGILRCVAGAKCEPSGCCPSRINESRSLALPKDA